VNKTVRTVIMVTAPLASLMTLAVGLRIGAEAGVHAVAVTATPRSPAVSRGYLRLTGYYDETGVKETVALSDLTVTVRVRESEQVIATATNADGIVDVPVELPGDIKDDEGIAIRVMRKSEPFPLVDGRITASVFAPERGEPLGYRALRPTKQTGDIVVDLSIPDGRVASETSTRAFVRMRAGGAVPPSLKVELAPEGGMDGSLVRICEAQGVAELALVATFPITGIGVVVTSGEGSEKKKGEWFGAVPVAMGAPRVKLPASEPANTPFKVEITASNARAGVYVMVDDARGRAFADYKPLRVSTNGAEAAMVDVPPLPEGLYFFTTSGDPKAIDALDSSAVARPFLVRKELPDVCSLLDSLAPAAAPIKRTPVLDGLYVRRQGDRQKKRRGLFLGILSLTVAALLEIVLLLSAAKDARADLAAHMSEVLDEDEARGIDADERRASSVPRMAVAILIAMLGFALIGAFVIWRV
jgi:hypothetical protein